MRAESDSCGRNGRWKGLIFRHNRVHVQNQGAVLRKSSPRGCTQPIFRLGRVKTSVDQSAQLISRRMKMGTLLCRLITRVHPVVSFTLLLLFWSGLLRCAPMMRNKTRWCTVRGLALSSWQRVHVLPPYRRASIASAFTIRVLRESATFGRS